MTQQPSMFPNSLRGTGALMDPGFLHDAISPHESTAGSSMSVADRWSAVASFAACLGLAMLVCFR